MVSSQEFHQARRVTPYADQAKGNSHASLMLKIALNHGYVDEKQYAHLSPQELTTEDLKGVCQSLSLVYRRRGWFKNFLVNSNGGTFPMLVCSLS